MKQYHYLIIGGGMAGDAAVRGIRELDARGTIGVLSMEPDPPYSRPNLSKSLWKGRKVEMIWRQTQTQGADILLERTVTRINVPNKTVRDETGEETTYKKLLFATGGSPFRLPFGEDAIIYYRSFRDYQRLRALSERGERFLVIGDGFIGTEIAAALTMVGKKVILVFHAQAIGAGMFPGDLAHFLNDYYRLKGVEVVPQDSVASLEPSGKRSIVHTKNGSAYEVDGVVAGIGIRPNVALAQQAGLQVENGIVVDEHLRTSIPDIYAAGDVANFYHSALGKRVRVEHEDNALMMGKLAGRNMAGANETYTHIPMFYSDLFELGYEAVGELSSKFEMVADWQDPFQKGVVYYLDGGRVRGVLLWNVWGAVDKARRLLEQPSPVDPAGLKGLL